MASYQVFSDLPRIQVDENGPLHDGYVWNAFGGDLENYWNPGQAMKTPPRTIATGFPLTSCNIQVNTNLQKQLLDSGRDSFPPQFSSGQYGMQGLKTFALEKDLYSPYEAQSPYPFVHTQRRFVSPEGSWSDDRSATELRSSSAGSDWSPRSTRSSAGDIYSADSRTFELDAQYFQDRSSIVRSQQMLLHAGYAATTPQRPLLGRSKSDSCVALREVQQYPDTIEPEDLQVEDVKMEYQFAQGNDVSLKLDCSEGGVQQHHDEDIGSSIQEESVESSSVVDAGEEDEVSDFTPNSRKKRRQSSQTSTTSPKSPTKRSPRQRLPSSTDKSKVTKRSNTQKSCPQHPQQKFKNASEYK